MFQGHAAELPDKFPDLRNKSTLGADKASRRSREGFTPGQGRRGGRGLGGRWKGRQWAGENGWKAGMETGHGVVDKAGICEGHGGGHWTWSGDHSRSPKERQGNTHSCCGTDPRDLASPEVACIEN